MQLVVTPEAAEYIGDRGGRLYLWQEPVGKAWATDHIAFIDPSRGSFIPNWVGGVGVMLGEDLALPQSVRISLSRIPRRLHIEWDGERWGRRGAADLDGGGGG